MKISMSASRPETRLLFVACYAPVEHNFDFRVRCSSYHHWSRWAGFPCGTVATAGGYICHDVPPSELMEIGKCNLPSEGCFPFLKKGPEVCMQKERR
jgi:hypothetical protein